LPSRIDVRIARKSKPRSVLPNKRPEKLTVCRELLAAEIAELSASPLARRAIDLARLDRAIKNWPTGDWHTEKIVGEYHFALSRGVAADSRPLLAQRTTIMTGIRELPTAVERISRVRRRVSPRA
jgi:hypothetical protein